MKELKLKHLGSFSELKAATWLLSLGHEVFRNVSSIGPVDLVAIKDGTTVLFDVKSVGLAGPRPDRKAPTFIPTPQDSLGTMPITKQLIKQYAPKASEEQIKLGVKFLLVGDGEFGIIDPRRFERVSGKKKKPSVKRKWRPRYVADFSDL